jgi:hypothetical protein
MLLASGKTNFAVFAAAGMHMWETWIPFTKYCTISCCIRVVGGLGRVCMRILEIWILLLHLSLCSSAPFSPLLPLSKSTSWVLWQPHPSSSLGNNVRCGRRGPIRRRRGLWRVESGESQILKITFRESSGTKSLLLLLGTFKYLSRYLQPLH